MAGKKEVRSLKSEVEKVAAPTFVLRADRPGHIRALMAVGMELPNEHAEILQTLREFELYVEARR